MPVIKIGSKHQITIPREVLNSLNLEVGDFLETRVQDNILVLSPKKLVTKDQEWFWTKKWQWREKETDAAIATGEVTRPFANTTDALKNLRKP